MSESYHRVSQERLYQRTIENDAPAPVVTSAGALVDALKVLGAKRITVVCPYMKPMTQIMIEYIEHEGTTVVDHRAGNPGQFRRGTA